VRRGLLLRKETRVSSNILSYSDKWVELGNKTPSGEPWSSDLLERASLPPARSALRLHSCLREVVDGQRSCLSSTDPRPDSLT